MVSCKFESIDDFIKDKGKHLCRQTATYIKAAFRGEQ